MLNWCVGHSSLGNLSLFFLQGKRRQETNRSSLTSCWLVKLRREQSMNNRIDNPECNSGTEWERETIDEWLESRLRGFSLGREYLGKWDERGESWRMKFALSLRCEGDGMGGEKKERRRKKEGTSGSWSGECFRQTMCATCSRCPGNVREGTGGERPPELLLSQEGLALSGGRVRVSALLEKEEGGQKKKRHPHIYQPPSREAALLLLRRRRWLQEAKRDAFFSSLNRTQLLRLSLSLIL